MRVSMASDVSYLFFTRSFINRVFEPEKRLEPPAWQPEQLLAKSADPFSKSVAETGDATDTKSADERHAAPTNNGDKLRCIELRIGGPCVFKLNVVSAIVTIIRVKKNNLCEDIILANRNLNFLTNLTAKLALKMTR